jgi:hypothetical protein
MDSCLDSARRYSIDCAVEAAIWADLNMDKFFDKFLESAASVYLPKLEEIADARKQELEEIMSMVRSDPDQVEAWFAKEIGKLGNMDMKDIVKNSMPKV